MMQSYAKSVRFAMSVSKFNVKTNYYKVLDVAENASEEQIKKAFKGLAKKYHPDVIKGNE